MVLDLEGRYRYIRELKDDDLAMLLLWDEDEEITELSGKKFGRANQIDLGWWRDLMTSPIRLGFAIQTEEGQLIGDVELEHITWRNGQAELRISIGDKRYWNQGYGSGAIRDVLDVAYVRYGLNRVYLRVKKDNYRAIRAYEKAGFKKIAMLAASGRLEGSTELVLMESWARQYAALKA
ncbi:GNAT family N-acetyltransferase [Sulfobacillus thermosulfidooxidans]|uniref:Protein N-acetyltransferase, RimJ/RimL family n=2 Tax=Sulfobacillus thermosulfidooxidans TaxID=28034 RepID=A0A1W1W8N4_SULTA|nr:GNAT family N-acetyltransferase [Sulfobacillus thermosulfidooxidans]OLZ10850.1 hypothetical protein BFX05_08820 [Sulfobacillus thermosulfidooxidans]OLZ14338.1 hypothetical protein BFX06_08645 [Sulfobacillus thermosulfidooxidans]OLZ19081.1 hypothetical protein BFX07_05040 [Sulfobacillus thermosulfidooxidans]PSR28543.1 MAG: GNAT family N-acetyltransferase [Sulfobacillus thermosulfidooxidans]SMC02644.1 Protein N-acetyltransferase, RimJ/RimL family [Sulfobacillus thermosulfidooxidans DSM 9293]